MAEGVKILPCIDCPRLKRSLQAIDYYREEDTPDLTDDSWEASWQRFRPLGVVTLMRASVEHFEHRAQEIGCDGPASEMIEGLEVDNICPVDDLIRQEIFQRQDKKGN